MTFPVEDRGCVRRTSVERHIAMNRLYQLVHELLPPPDEVNPVLRRAAVLAVLLVPGALIVGLGLLLVLRIGAILGVSRERVRESSTTRSG
jgi:hypothetical protein